MVTCRPSVLGRRCGLEEASDPACSPLGSHSKRTVLVLSFHSCVLQRCNETVMLSLRPHWQLVQAGHGLVGIIASGAPGDTPSFLG